MNRIKMDLQNGKRVICALLTLLMLMGLLVYGIPADALAVECPTEAQVYDAMMALKADYPEGRHWTNGNYYAWKGGFFGGGYGCVAFAFILSDAAFGSLPCRLLYNITIKNVHVGDILRLYNDSHTVIVTEVHDTYLVLAEGNYNDSVHWGRKLYADEVAEATYLMTRYPLGTFVNYHTITYNANGGSVTIPAEYKDEGAGVKITADEPTRLGYEVWGWAYRPDAAEPDFLPGDIYKEDKDVTLYAIWRPIHYPEIKNTFPKEYEVVFYGLDVLYEFTPARTAEYTFESSADGMDPCIKILDTNGVCLFEADDIVYNKEYDFALTCKLTAGVKYYIDFGLWRNIYYGDSYKVTVDCKAAAVPGDIDNDGVAGLQDVSLLFRWWNGSASSAALNLENGDFDGNKTVDLRDAAAIFRSL